MIWHEWMEQGGVVVDAAETANNKHRRLNLTTFHKYHIVLINMNKVKITIWVYLVLCAELFFGGFVSEELLVALTSVIQHDVSYIMIKSEASCIFCNFSFSASHLSQSQNI